MDVGIGVVDVGVVGGEVEGVDSFGVGCGM